MWYVTNQKHGVSALGLQRILGLGSYQTAWAWLHKLRRAMVRPGRDLLGGAVEVDDRPPNGAMRSPYRPTRPSQGLPELRLPSHEWRPWRLVSCRFTLHWAR